MATIEQYEGLRDELDTDPLGRGYAGMTDQQAADSGNTIDRPAEVAIPGIESDIRASGKWTQYRERSEAVDQDGLYLNQAMREFMDMFYSSVNQESTFTSSGYLAGVIDNMVAEGSMGAGAGAALRAYDNNQQSRFGEIGFGVATPGDVAYARAL